MMRLESKLDSVQTDMIESMKEELNWRDIGGGMHHAVLSQAEIQLLREDIRRIRMDQPVGGDGELDGYTINTESNRRSTQLYSYDGRLNILPKFYNSP